ncbi:Receptor-like kinase lip1 [Thalictrum thalictroides]|uniref:Receptor-like kinase lip1 n=1 Tax=Thalictrum thalictroides TaxID=46969 RepID=A0A7J6VHF3_THATH|nr:Receptor-like kinase lip1 [Thalictrum thalictroides]
MVWELGLGCFQAGKQQKLEKFGRVEENLEEGGDKEHNKSWLLAKAISGDFESTPNNPIDPQSVHSSFRFSFGSQAELDALNCNFTNVSTVLMVNLETGLHEPLSKELKWRRIESLERNISPMADTLVRFSYAEIRSATRNFSKGRVLGRGAMSCVFKGRIGFRRAGVAIKRLDKEDKESAKAFCRELMIASSLDNRNIVPLVGFCLDPDEGLFLVYKYVSGGSLEHHLHEKRSIKGCYSLTWSARFKIALGIAEAIAYLHNGAERCVVHRDIKPSNILLSSKNTPKLCDFGLATSTPAPSIPFLCKTVKGTFGYLAPEYFQHGKVSDKTDVYAFGVVLLELITGRKPIEARKSPEDENLVLWAKPLLEKGAMKELLDPRIKLSTRNLKIRTRNSRQMTQMVEAAAACINSEESCRPSIDQVISILRGEERICSSRNKPALTEYGFLDCYPHSHDLQTKNEMKSHFALAMLGVSDLEDDDNLYCR